MRSTRTETTKETGRNVATKHGAVREQNWYGHDATVPSTPSAATKTVHSQTQHAASDAVSTIVTGTGSLKRTVETTTAAAAAKMPGRASTKPRVCHTTSLQCSAHVGDSLTCLTCGCRACQPRQKSVTEPPHSTANTAEKTIQAGEWPLLMPDTTIFTTYPTDITAMTSHNLFSTLLQCLSTLLQTLTRLLGVFVIGPPKDGPGPFPPQPGRMMERTGNVVVAAGAIVRGAGCGVRGKPHSGLRRCRDGSGEDARVAVGEAPCLSHNQPAASHLPLYKG